MKLLPFLFSAMLFSGFLSGCASSPTRARATGRTIQPIVAPDSQLRFSIDDSGYALLPELGFPEPVTDLDKLGILQRFGRPSEQVSPDLWVYWQFYSREDAAENGGHDTLVISFARSRVLTMKLIQGDHLRAYLANARSPRPELVQQ